MTDTNDRSRWSRYFDLVKAAGKEFGVDKCGRMAAAIAYRSVFALAPLLLVAVSVASLFLDEPADNCDPDVTSCETVQDRLVAEVETVSEPLAETVDAIMTNAQQNQQFNGIVGTALFLFTASSLFFEIQGSLNTIFHAPEDRTRGIMSTIRARGIGALAVLVLGGVMVILFVANAVVTSAGDLLIGWLSDLGLNPDVFAPLITIGGSLVSLVLLIVLFAIQFQTFTVQTIPWRAAWRGGAVTAFVFALAAFGLGAYFSYQAQSSGQAFSAGGFAGGAVLILFLVFVLAQIYLFGAEFTKVYTDYVVHGDVVQPSERRKARPNYTADDVRAAATTDLIAKVGVFAFVAGWFLGWFKDR